MCGEKHRLAQDQMGAKGSPPRVRGKARLPKTFIARFGITPACAGKSVKSNLIMDFCWDHPRGCGEKGLSIAGQMKNLGSPPRVRGKAERKCDGRMVSGITPACAGKSNALLREAGWIWGSPPRVRGKARRQYDNQQSKGITPACAGKSSEVLMKQFTTRDHPRVCGEKMILPLWAMCRKGSPPRVRGKADTSSHRFCAQGITPACAGKSIWP